MKKEIKKIFDELGIIVVYLFGSKALGNESRLSDVDIGIVLKKTLPEKQTRYLYLKLHEIFTDIYPSSKLDIVFLQQSSVSLQNSAVTEGKILYELDPDLTVDYENHVINQYLDFRPVLDYFDRIQIERYVDT